MNWRTSLRSLRHPRAILTTKGRVREPRLSLAGQLFAQTAQHVDALLELVE